MVNGVPHLDALLIEASFPNSMAKLGRGLASLYAGFAAARLKKLNHNGMDILAVHLKPAYRDTIIAELKALNIPDWM